MKITKITLENFKAFQKLEFCPNANFSVIIGENNIGKSTLFEAILLWEKCYDELITKDRSSFYNVSSSTYRYIPFQELHFLRVYKDTDLFYKSPHKNKITLELNLDGINYSLCFEISKPSSVNDAYLRFKPLFQSRFKEFASALKTKRIKLDDAIFVYQTKPISNISSREPFMNKGQILRKIATGSSHEILRNKIIQNNNKNIEDLESTLSSVLEKKVQFLPKNTAKRDSDEFIKLNVQLGDEKELDIHLQGSGFLQATEIFSTLDFVDSELSILLVDEPDSHVHSKLQKNLINEIRDISNSQTFVISHNDTFVSEIKDGELFYINSSVKEEGELNCLDSDKFDLVKKDLGGVILALDNFNNCDRVCFVEGEDDIKYIESLFNIYKNITGVENYKKLSFYYLRGRDFILKKVDHYKRLMHQLFPKDFYTIIDKDFCSIDVVDDLCSKISRKLGGANRTFYHNGYCIEASLFSDQEKLEKVMRNWSNSIPQEITDNINIYSEDISQDILNITSDLYIKSKEKFTAQKGKASRPEMSEMDFDDFASEVSDNLSFIMYKGNIKSFIESFESGLMVNLVQVTDDDSSDYYASCLFNKYLDSINHLDDMYDSHISLIQKLYGIETS